MTFDEIRFYNSDDVDLASQLRERSNVLLKVIELRSTKSLNQKLESDSDENIENIIVVRSQHTEQQSNQQNHALSKFSVVNILKENAASAARQNLSTSEITSNSAQQTSLSDREITNQSRSVLTREIRADLDVFNIMNELRIRKSKRRDVYLADLFTSETHSDYIAAF